MGAEQDADAAAQHGLTLLADGPGKACARTEVIPVRVVGFLWIAKRAEVQFPKIASRFHIDDLRIGARRGPDADRRVVVIAQSEVQHELLVHPPIVLNESAE